jgi:hypothetical protein
MPQFQFRVFQISRWQMALGVSLFLAILLGLMILALGVFLLVLPVLIVGGLLAYFFRGRRLRPNEDEHTFEANYRVIEQKQLDRSDNE